MTNEKGFIAWMAKNPVAANLLVGMIILSGIFLGIMRFKLEVFPEIDLDLISVQVPYPGASPEEVEQGIVLAVEEEVRGIDGVKSVDSVAGEGAGVVTVEVILGQDPEKVLSDVKNAVDRITSFPLDAEEPIVSLIKPKRQVISLIISGDQDLRTLHDLAEDARAQLLSRGGITLIDLQGVPPLEVAVEVRREDLERYGLTLDEVAARIRASSLEIPAGGVDAEAGEILVKVDDRRRLGPEFGDILVRGTRNGGGVLRLADIATIRDTYAETDQASYLDGNRAVQVIAFRVGNESPITIAEKVKTFAAELQERMPAGVNIKTIKDDSVLLKSRINLLVVNAIQGFILVVLVLWLFMNVRLAFWVGFGIPVSFLGAFAFLPAADISINMISLFGFIIVLGMVVDDAIVIGENIYEKTERGVPPLQAAVEGTREMIVPVTFAVLTTVAAFAPLFFVPGVSGKIFAILPFIVITVLLVSLVEGFLSLPAHLGHKGVFWRVFEQWFWFLDIPSKYVTRGLNWFSERLYRPILEASIRYRYAAIGIAAAAFIVSLGMAISGAVPFSPFPRLEGNQVTASARLPYGAPMATTEQVRAWLEDGARKGLAELDEPVLVAMYTRVGEGITPGGAAGGQTPVGSHLVTVELELLPSEERTITAEQVARAWEKNVPPIPGLESLQFTSNFGPGGGVDVDVQLTHIDQTQLIAAADEVTKVMKGYADLTSVNNTYSQGKSQVTYALRPEAATLGITSNDVARQLRAFFFGAEALREQRGRNELKVMVRLPRDQRDSEHALEQARIRTPTGGFVPIGQVADLTRERSPTDIRREDGRRVVDVTASLAPGVKSNQRVVRDLQADVFPKLKAEYPGLSMRFAGAQADTNEALNTLGLYYLVGLAAIYVLLAIPFKSYFQPIIIMLAIPLGFVGALWGHVALGYGLSMISMFGIVALSGVVVNDSLVLIDAANERRRAGDNAHDAILWAGIRRLRPILLTSFTTFGGLMPLIFEQSVQARFIIPMAISLGIGIMFATFVTLLVIPAGYMILEDLFWMFHQIGVGIFGKKMVEEVEHENAEDDGVLPIPTEQPAK
jgi:multidrug efflux pump subunit AcrB